MSKVQWKLRKFQGRSTSSTGLQNQYTGYSYNVAGGAPLTLAIEFIPLSPYRLFPMTHGYFSTQVMTAF